MPSSTSSFEVRIPDHPWARIWFFTAALATTTVGALEIGLRAHGLVPSVTDDAQLWCHTRGTLRADAPDEVVLIGASRCQLGIDTDVFASEWGGRQPVQLAIDGSSCIPVLDELSRDERFRGLLVCDVLPEAFFAGIDLNQGKQAEYVQLYEEQAACAGIEQALRTAIQSRLVIRLPEVSLGRLFDDLRHLKLPQPSYLVTSPDRCCRADYRLADVAAHSRRREAAAEQMRTAATPRQWAEDLSTLREMVARIQRRGGEVCFVRFPTSGKVRSLEDERFPRTVYWDTLGPLTGAITINFADYPDLQLNCAEGSHLDTREAKQFTAALAAILKQRLRPGQPDGPAKSAE